MTTRTDISATTDPQGVDPRRRVTRVGIWGVFGTGNFGNEATLSALLERLRSPSWHTTLICEQPSAAAQDHGVPGVRMGPVADVSGRRRSTRIAGLAGNRLRTFFGALRVVRFMDSVVLAGTGSFERLGSGAWGVPFEMWSLATACLLFRRPLVILNVGAESLPRPSARFFVRQTSRAATYRSYRDESTRDALTSMGGTGHGDVVATDLAFGLTVETRSEVAADMVVVGLMNYRGRDDTEHDRVETHYRHRVTVLIDLLRTDGFDVVVVGGDEVDLDFARSLSLPQDVPIVEARTPQEIVDVVGRAAVTVATRYHTLIMSLLAGTPVASIGYGEKHRSMLLQLGLDDTHRDVESFDPAEVAALVRDLTERRATITPHIAEGTATARRLLDEQWADVVRVLTRRTEGAR